MGIYSGYRLLNKELSALWAPEGKIKSLPLAPKGQRHILLLPLRGNEILALMLSPWGLPRPRGARYILPPKGGLSPLRGREMTLCNPLPSVSQSEMPGRRGGIYCLNVRQIRGNICPKGLCGPLWAFAPLGQYMPKGASLSESIGAASHVVRRRCPPPPPPPPTPQKKTKKK